MLNLPPVDQTVMEGWRSCITRIPVGLAFHTTVKFNPTGTAVSMVQPSVLKVSSAGGSIALLSSTAVKLATLIVQSVVVALGAGALVASAPPAFNFFLLLGGVVVGCLKPFMVEVRRKW